MDKNTLRNQLKKNYRMDDYIIVLYFRDRGYRYVTREEDIEHYNKNKVVYRGKVVDF